MKKLLLLFLLLLAANASAYIVAPNTTGFGGKNLTDNARNMTLNWHINNASMSLISSTGKCYQAVVWFASADSTDWSTVHSCQTSHGTLSNVSFCTVTDEFSRAFYADMLYNNDNNSLADCYMNTMVALNDSGNTYTGAPVTTGVGNSTEWTGYFNYSASQGWRVWSDDVADTATDANAYMILALAKINTTSTFDAGNRSRAGGLMQKYCYGLVKQEIRDVRTSGLTYRHRSGNLTWVPASGSNVNTALNSGSFYFQAYDGPIIEALGACRHYYNDSNTAGPFNWTDIADGVFGAHLQAAVWTGSVLKIPIGRQGHWTNISSGNTPLYVCDQNCNSTGGTTVPGTDGVTLGIEFPDSIRAINICRAAYVWQNLTGVPLTNSSTYCQQYAAKSSIQANATSCNTVKYDQNGASYDGESPDGGFRKIGLCMSLDFMYNTTNFASKISTFNSHYGCSGGKCSMDSQAAFGVYDKSFGLTDMAYAMGLADSIFVTPASTAPFNCETAAVASGNTAFICTSTGCVYAVNTSCSSTLGVNTVSHLCSTSSCT